MEFSEQQQERFLDELRNGVRRGMAADTVELPRPFVREYIRTHDDFAAKIDDAELDALENVEEAVYQAAISGNVQAAKMWLDYKNPRRGSAPVDLPGVDPMDDELQRMIDSAGD